MDKFSYAIGLGIGQNLLGMGARGINVEDFAQAIHDVLDGKETAISHTEARDIVNNYFEEMEKRMNAENIEKGKAFLAENQKKEGVKVTASGLQYEVLQEGNGKSPKATDKVRCHYEGTLIDGTQLITENATAMMRCTVRKSSDGKIETDISFHPCYVFTDLWKPALMSNAEDADLVTRFLAGEAQMPIKVPMPIEE